MANPAPTVAWICVGPAQLEAATSMLADAPSDVSSSTRVGRIGAAHVVVASSPCLQSLQTEEIWARVQAQSVARGLPRLEAIVVTGRAAGQAPNASPGDVLISPCSGNVASPDAPSYVDILQRATDVLRGEVGGDGYWLPSSSNVLGSATANGALEGLAQRYPRLHYLQGFEDMMEISPYTGDSASEASSVVILGVDGVQSSGNDSSEPKAAQSAASYARELIQLMAEPSVRMIPSFEGTEQIIPARAAPQIPPFHAHLYPRYGNAVLLVIPTENTSKTAILQECLVQRAPIGLKLYTIAVPVESDVGEQPYNDAGAQGAYNRISNALKRLADGEQRAEQTVFAEHGIGTVMAASIENYIQTREVARPADFGVVVVHNATTGKTSACSSLGVTVPPEYIGRARRFGCADGDADHGNVTVGAVLAARVPGLDKADWHAVLAGRSRYDLLTEAVEGMQIPW